ncbi:DUF4381 domain-containing protein [Labrenzia sp. OB1]|uniref:DUF4381 domain-containing protein n=1 Tax=Labrenzia sp. OB1 TaxID=1561204 RepID=UPI0007B27ACE|nr:DUF4381 domain-containing protein [Labrenzia sp. OB1]KZM49769.1 hypothetical protein OA90_12720 [Labrenzia sp. OB1]
MKDAWEGLNLVDLLDLLDPVQEPPPISMFPQTAGWIWLGLALLLGLAALVWQFLRYRRKNAYRRQALRELLDCPDDAAHLATLVRRTALAAFPRDEVASLCGKNWLTFLDRAYGGNGFSAGPGEQLASAPYAAGQKEASLKALVRTWIRKHRGPGA